MVTNFDYASRTANLANSTEEEVQQDLKPFECGVDIMGKTHDELYHCANIAYDPIVGEQYCRARRIRNLLLQRHDYRWLSSMLGFYWQNGVGEKGIEFLESSGFITSYKYVSFIKFVTYVGIL